MRKVKATIEFLDGYTPKTLDSSHPVVEYGEPPIKKGRADKGKIRTKYDSSLPIRYRSYLARANKKRLVFSLTVEQFEHLCKQPCVYCGLSSRITIDRKDSSEGYHINNCQPCCFHCNIMKYTYSETEFLNHIRSVYIHSIDKNG